MADRLALIRARHAEAGGGDADKAWLLDEVERQRKHRHWALIEARANEIAYQAACGLWQNAEKEIEQLRELEVCP